ncbi:MAG: rubrerythrin family protein [Thermoprotei archaeon]|nr:MAG: rubrerythrin family protein [Thermoprotei archaeon]
METLKNLVKAFIGESQARNRYVFYAGIAEKEGYVQVAQVFRLTASNEEEHAETLFKLIQRLRGDLRELTVDAAAPLTLSNTAENLKAAAAGERYEYSEMYPHFAEVAEKEGFLDVAATLRAIAEAERHHEERYLKLLRNIEGGTVWRKDHEVYWVCLKCGYVHYGEEPPKKCPSCGHDRNYFAVKCEEY